MASVQGAGVAAALCAYLQEAADDQAPGSEGLQPFSILDCPSSQQGQQPCSSHCHSLSCGPNKNEPGSACYLPDRDFQQCSPWDPEAEDPMSAGVSLPGAADSQSCVLVEHNKRTLAANAAAGSAKQLGNQMGQLKSYQQPPQHSGGESNGVEYSADEETSGIKTANNAQLQRYVSDMQLPIRAVIQQASKDHGRAVIDRSSALLSVRHIRSDGDFQSSLPLPKQFAFAMLFSGYMPQAAEVLHMQQRVDSIRIPSLHCFGSGSQDWQVSTAASQALLNWFSQERDQCTTKKHIAGHMIPSTLADTEQYVTFMEGAMSGCIDAYAENMMRHGTGFVLSACFFQTQSLFPSFIQCACDRNRAWPFQKMTACLASGQTVFHGTHDVKSSTDHGCL